MNPSKYNRRVSVQELISTRNPDGSWSDEWQEKQKIWAKKEDKGGDEYFVAKASNAVRTVIWTIRFNADLYKTGEGKRLLYDGESYDIKNVADKKGFRRELEIVSEAVVSDGR